MRRYEGEKVRWVEENLAGILKVGTRVLDSCLKNCSLLNNLTLHLISRLQWT